MDREVAHTALVAGRAKLDAVGPAAAPRLAAVVSGLDEGAAATAKPRTCSPLVRRAARARAGCLSGAVGRWLAHAAASGAGAAVLAAHPQGRAAVRSAGVALDLCRRYSDAAQSGGGLEVDDDDGDGGRALWFTALDRLVSLRARLEVSRQLPQVSRCVAALLCCRRRRCPPH